jgi:inositol oxygenase
MSTLCSFGSEPLWSVASESYPLGCQFSEHIGGSQYLTACPDRRCSIYNSPTGIYRPGCGLDSVHFTWTGTEYLTLVLLLNRVRLPFEAIFMLRFKNFASTIHHGAYRELYSARDEANLPHLRRFAGLLERVRDGTEPPGSAPSAEAVVVQCQAAILRYFATPRLNW